MASLDNRTDKGSSNEDGSAGLLLEGAVSEEQMNKSVCVIKMYMPEDKADQMQFVFTSTRSSHGLNGDSRYGQEQERMHVNVSTQIDPDGQDRLKHWNSG